MITNVLLFMAAVFICIVSLTFIFAAIHTKTNCTRYVEEDIVVVAPSGASLTPVIVKAKRCVEWKRGK